jgi:serine protease
MRTALTIAAAGLAAAVISIAPAAHADDGPADGPLSFAVDRTVRPQDDTHLVDGRPQPVASVADSFGHQGDFVADELVVVTNDDHELDELLARRHGEVLETVDPSSSGLEGLRRRHLVRIDTGGVETDDLERNAAALAPGVGGLQRVSSDQGLRLLAAAAAEKAGGLDIGVNWITHPHSIRTRRAQETQTLPNDFTWANYCEAGSVPFVGPVSCPQSIGVGEAWSLLARAGVLPKGKPDLDWQDRITIAMLDGGFAPTDIDRPSAVNSFSSAPNPATCTGGTPCPWHGTNTTSAAMGLVDNRFGAAGVAGPVARPLLLAAANDIVESTKTAIKSLSGSGARIANMSFGVEIPAVWAWSTWPADAVLAAARNAGVALFASAGNDAKNVDVTKSSIFGPYEDATFWPCEAPGVICVGALASNSRGEASFSNFGTGGLDANTVDLWAPGFAFVGLDPGDPTYTTTPDGAKVVTGTSIASPQAAGVAALVWAANPSLSEGQLETVLSSTAQTPSISPGKSKGGDQMIDAQEAVRIALGGDMPPELRIVKPLGGSFSRGIVHADAFATDDLSTPSIIWFVDGKPVDTGAHPDLYLHFFGFGQHRLTAVATDSHGWNVPDADDGVTITLTNKAPTVSIAGPPNGSVFYARQGFFPKGEPICLDGVSSDVNNNPAQLTDAQVSWSIDNGVKAFTGHSAGLSSLDLPVGFHTIRFSGTDDGGLSDTTAVTIEIRSGTPYSNGITRAC